MATATQKQIENFLATIIGSTQAMTFDKISTTLNCGDAEIQIDAKDIQISVKPISTATSPSISASSTDTESPSQAPQTIETTNVEKNNAVQRPMVKYPFSQSKMTIAEFNEECSEIFQCIFESIENFGTLCWNSSGSECVWGSVSDLGILEVVDDFLVESKNTEDDYTVQIYWPMDNCEVLNDAMIQWRANNGFGHLDTNLDLEGMFEIEYPIELLCDVYEREYPECTFSACEETISKYAQALKGNREFFEQLKELDIDPECLYDIYEEQGGKRVQLEIVPNVFIAYELNEKDLICNTSIERVSKKLTTLHRP